MPQQPSAVDQVFRHWDPTWGTNPAGLIGAAQYLDSPFVDIQNVAEYCNAGRGTGEKKTFPRIGRCFSPWKSSFVFWHEPLKDFGVAYKLAMVLQTQPTEEDPDAIMNGIIFQAESKGGPWTVMATMFCLSIPPGGILEEDPSGLQMFKMSIAGDPRTPIAHPSFSMVRPIADRIASPEYVQALDMAGKVLPGWTKDSQADIQILLAAFSFAHCKNVEIAEAGRTSPPPKWRAQGTPSVKYRVVKIDTKMSKRSSGPHVETGRHTSLHIVRGHFKSYTAEKPLLGRHVGTYWWPDNTRGDVAVGEVRKAYKVGT